MKFNFFAVICIALFFASCSGGYNGQLVGVQDRPGWNNIIPYGMVYIPSGTLHIGQSDQDYNNSLTQRTKSISIQGFFMDETEVTNNEYRQFVNWVRDSIAAGTLGGDFIKTNEKTGKESVNWESMAKFQYDDEEYSESLGDMYVAENEQLNGKVELDNSKWVFEYYWLDIKEAAKVSNRGKPRSEFFRSGSAPVYPDTLVWVRDFSYSYNEPMTRNYFWHPAFDDYPVVGVTWAQANAFSAWRTKFWSDFREERGEPINDPFRLPTESEWEYAARGGRDMAPYPWGGPYLRNSKGCLLANFKPGRGNYPDDGGFYTVRADAYWPNDYGLFNMAGNASEWTITAYQPASYSFVHDLNPDIRYDAKDDDPITLKRKVIRGGSWKDIGYYLQTGVRHWEYQDSAKSYIGFRNVLTFLGRSINDSKTLLLFKLNKSLKNQKNHLNLMNAIAHFFETSKGKRIKNAFIGVGAAVVLMGALFKLMSWPGAGGMLTAGLVTEALIFAILGLLPPHKEYYWEKIYPELDISPEEEAANVKAKSGGKKSVTEELDSMLEKAKVESSLIQRLGTNLEKFSGNLESLTQVANVAGSTNEYATKAKEAGAALDQMKAAYANATTAVNGLASTTAEFKGYQEQIQSVSKNLASLNSLYENELNGVTGNLKSLNKNLSGLNTVYGNMLSAMGVKG